MKSTCFAFSAGRKRGILVYAYITNFNYLFIIFFAAASGISSQSINHNNYWFFAWKFK